MASVDRALGATVTFAQDGTVFGASVIAPTAVNDGNNLSYAHTDSGTVTGGGLLRYNWYADLLAAYPIGQLTMLGDMAGFDRGYVYYSNVSAAGPWIPAGTFSPGAHTQGGDGLPVTVTFDARISARYWRVAFEHDYAGLVYWYGFGTTGPYGFSTWQILETDPSVTPGVGGPALLIEYFENDPATFGPAALAGVIHDAVKIGWSWYSRFPSNAFFTLRQASIHNSRLAPDETHVRITYFNPQTGYSRVVFTGRISEPDSSGDDVVWTAWNYLSELSLSRTGYRTLYPNKKIGTEIAALEWAAARTATYSLLNHVATGAIEDPLGSDGVTVITTDARFGVIDVPRLLLMYDLTEIGRANTINNVTFGITREAPFTFSLTKNAGSRRTAKALIFPGVVRDYRYVPGFAALRNDLATIGTASDGSTVEIVKTDETNAAAYGRRQDVFTIKTLSGLAGAATEADAQVAITARAVKEAVSLSKHLVLDLRPFAFEPFDGWELEDTVPVEIRRGRDVIDADYRIVGIRGQLDERGYHPQLLVTLPTAA